MMKLSSMDAVAPLPFPLLLLTAASVSALVLPGVANKRDVQYTVQAGDTGNAIAHTEGISFQTLAAANPSVNWNALQIGSSLDIPGGGSSGAPASSSGGSSGPCQGVANVCTGDITHWDGGLGACGWNINTGSDMQIALPVGLMGAQSNGNPYCGRSVTIQAPGRSPVTATVGDKCMGCSGDSIDLTNALFSAVAPNADGRMHGVQWFFN